MFFYVLFFNAMVSNKCNSRIAIDGKLQINNNRNIDLQNVRELHK